MRPRAEADRRGDQAGEDVGLPPALRVRVTFDAEHPVAALIVAANLAAGDPGLSLAPAQIGGRGGECAHRNGAKGLADADAFAASAQADVAAGPAIDRRRKRPRLHGHVGRRSRTNACQRSRRRERPSQIADHENQPA